jgi:hypothetical protein
VHNVANQGFIVEIYNIKSTSSVIKCKLKTFEREFMKKYKTLFKTDTTDKIQEIPEVEEIIEIEGEVEITLEGDELIITTKKTELLN